MSKFAVGARVEDVAEHYFTPARAATAAEEITRG